MDKRILVGSIAALGVMLGFDLLTKASGGSLDLPLRTGMGTLVLGNLAITFAAMTLGGWIARRRFRWIAVALSALVWIMAIVALTVAPPPSGAGAALSLAVILKFNALTIVLELVASWLGAMLGELLAARKPRPVAA